jgi:polysaccharide deacetylase family protein (PEP-CTERM system associated)
MSGIKHYFTVDVEEHFQVSAFEDRIPRSSWDAHASRVAANVDRLLELLAASRTRGTFFILGLVAERTPEVVKAIAGAGHEVASHGWEHRRVTDLTPDEFRTSVRRSKQLLEQMVGAPVLGYRAPSYSIVAGREWALDVLAEEGYRYDSSLFPVRRPGYGYAAGGRDPHWLERAAGRLAEFPPATWRVLGANLPAAGGAYSRRCANAKRVACPVCSISIRGRWTPTSHASVSRSPRGCGTTPACGVPSPAYSVCSVSFASPRSPTGWASRPRSARRDPGGAARDRSGRVGRSGAAQCGVDALSPVGLA